jgi:predicted nucleic acid-binding protein
LRFILDTNVLVSALRSQLGASAALLRVLPVPGWEMALSVPLYLEYQDVLLRPGMVPAVFSPADITALCRYLASIAHPQEIHFLWRSFLADWKDDMLLEVAAAAGARYVVTHNVGDFKGSESFGVRALAPREFLRLVGLRP